MRKGTNASDIVESSCRRVQRGSKGGPVIVVGVHQIPPFPQKNLRAMSPARLDSNRRDHLLFQRPNPMMASSISSMPAALTALINFVEMSTATAVALQSFIISPLHVVHVRRPCVGTTAQVRHADNGSLFANGGKPWTGRSIVVLARTSNRPDAGGKASGITLS